MTYPTKHPFDFELFNPQRSSVLCVHTFVENEPDKFIVYIGEYIDQNPELRPVMDLLLSTYDFRMATTVDPFFVNKRKHTTSSNLARDNFMKMEKALVWAFMELEQYKDKPEYELFKACIQYCLGSVKQAIINLKNTNDEIYLHYWHGSALELFFKKQQIEI